MNKLRSMYYDWYIRHEKKKARKAKERAERKKAKAQARYEALKGVCAETRHKWRKPAYANWRCKRCGLMKTRVYGHLYDPSGKRVR